MATQTVTLSNTAGSNFTYVGSPPDDNFTISDTGGANYTITLGNGTDQLNLLNGNNTVTLGNGTDRVTTGAGNNTVTTGNGNSTITEGNGNDTVTVGTGANAIGLGTGLDTVSTGAGDNVVSVSGATVSGDTVNGALTSGDGSTNRLVLTAPGTMSPVDVSGFQSYQLANGGPNSLTLSEANFARLPGGSITVIGGNSGNTVNAAALSAAHSVVIDAGAGIDALTGGAGNDRFVFAPSNLAGDTVNGSGGTNTLELQAGGAGILSGLGTNFANISTVVLDSNATWTLGIGSPAAFTGTIVGFAVGDVIDLSSQPYSSNGSIRLETGNVLQVVDGGSTYDVNLDPGQSFAGALFNLAPDGSGGTDVTLGAPLRSDLASHGLSDTLMTDSTNGNLVVDEVADGQMTYQALGGLGPQWQIEGEGAFLGDGKDGFLLWDDNPSNGAIVVGEDDGGTVQYTQIGGVGPNWQFEGNGDFLGDGTTDFLLENSDNGTLVVGEVSGGTAQYTAIGGVGSNWQLEGTGNYLGDGKTGFLMENSDNGALVVGEVSGGTAQYTAVGGLGSEWQFEGTGNLLGHGQDDFLILNQNTGALVVGEVTGGAAQYTQIGALGAEWQFLGTGNYDGASASEFLMRNGNTGALVVGTVADGVANYTQIGGVGTEWNFSTTHVATVA
jgi:hypothetical protein